MVLRILGSLSLMIGLSTASFAAENYFGISIVDAEYKQTAYKADDTGYAVTFGHQFMLFPEIETAVELSYADIINTSISGQLGTVNIDVNALDISLRVGQDMGRFAPFARLGYSDGTSKGSINGTAANIDDKTSFYGLGMDVAVTDLSFFRIEYNDGYEYKDADAQQFRLGLFTRF